MNHASGEDNESEQSRLVVRAFYGVLVAFLDFDICHLLVANIKIKKSHQVVREG